MRLKAFYETINGDYEGTIKRFPSESILELGIIDFIENNSFVTLLMAMTNKNLNEAFTAVYALQGSCMTLGFSELAQSSGEMMKAVTTSAYEETEMLFKKVEKDYSTVVNAIKDLELQNDF